MIDNSDLNRLTELFAGIQHLVGNEKNFFKALLSTAMSYSGADEGGILSIAHDEKSMRIEIWDGVGVELKSRILPISSPPESVCARCFWSSRPERIGNIEKEPLFQSKSDSNIRSLLAVPVIHKGKVIGILNLESLTPNFFAEEHQVSLSNFAREASSLWDIIVTSVRATRHKDLLESLQKVSQSLLNDNPVKTLAIILDQALQLTGSDLGGVCILPLEGDALLVGPAKGLRDIKNEEKPRIKKGTGFVWKSIGERKTQNISDTREHPEHYLDLSAGQIRSLLCAPMLIGNEPVGALNIESKHLNHFSLLDEEILTSFASQAAISVKMLTAKDRFAAADALAGLGSLSGNLTHRINNQVGGIRVLSKMLAKRLELVAPAEREIANEIHTAAAEVLTVVEHYESISKYDEKQLNVSNLIKVATAQIRLPPGIKLELQLIEPSPVVCTSETALSEVVIELVRNSVKSLQEKGNIIVKLWQNDTHVYLSVSDNGSPIPQDLVTRIFEKGYTSRSEKIGSGFGLWWIHSFMTKLGGAIRLSPSDNTGNTFELIFPKHLPSP